MHLYYKFINFIIIECLVNRCTACYCNEDYTKRVHTALNYRQHPVTGKHFMAAIGDVKITI